MKIWIALVGMGLVVAASTSAFAGGQQEKMKGCNKEAKAAGMKGDERKAFMKKCLSKDYVLKSGGSATAAPSAAAVQQQDKMKACSSQAAAKGLAGDGRKNFISACLKG